jgi:ABC-2 type transport system permease protein
VVKVLAIARKDLRSTARNGPALAMMLLAPLALAALLGFAFGGGDSFQIAATKVALANDDAGFAAGQAGETTSGAGGESAAGASAQPAAPAGDTLVDILMGEGLEDVLDVTEAADAAGARRAVDDGDAAVAVVVPPDFTAALYGTEGATAAVELYVNPTYEFGSAITESVVTQALLDFNGARAAAAVAVATAGEDADHEEAAQTAAARFVQDGGVSTALVLTDRQPQAEDGEGEQQASTIGLVLAGMMVFFMFFGASNVARTILTEDQDGTLPRMLTTPTSATTILGGKFASVFLTVTVQTIVLIVAGRLLFGIDWGSPGVVAVLILVAAAVASGLGLLVISLVRTPGQAGAIGAGVYLVLALLGGNFTGTATSTGTYATIQGFTPNGPLLRAFDDAMRGGSLADVAGELVLPIVFAVAFFAVAVWRFRRRYV